MADYHHCEDLDGGPCAHLWSASTGERFCKLRGDPIEEARQCGFLDYYLKVRGRAE